MNQFELLRYVRKWRWMIVAFMMIGVLLVYEYASSNQSYTSTVYIQYTNDTASQGLTPNGGSINTDEIYCSTVIADTISDLGISASVESIRKNCQVTSVIPSDIQSLMSTALENGEQYEYFPVEYQVKFTCGSAYSSSYALMVMDSIIGNYFTYYNNHYVSSVATPNNAQNVSTEKYDYLECVELLESSAKEMINFLNQKSEQNWTFRASSTGYSFQDLADAYNFYLDYTIPKLYTSVMDASITHNLDSLVDKYQNKITKAELNQSKMRDQITELKELIDSYSVKNKEAIEKHYGTTDSSSYILNDVKDGYKDKTPESTEYDKMILEYADMEEEYESIAVDIQHYNYILNKYTGAAAPAEDSAEVQEVKGQITELSGKMTELYKILWNTASEYDEYRSAEYICTPTNISVSAAINVNLYVLIAIVLFGIIGFFFAVLLGRVGDLLEYYMYIDKRVGIYNRAKCDAAIDEYRNKLLQENFSCLVVCVRNLPQINYSVGRSKCDELMRILAQLLKEGAASGNGSAYYNEHGQFIMFMPSSARARMMDLAAFVIRSFSDKIDAQDGHETIALFDIGIGASCSTDDGVYEIRKLLQLAIVRSNEKKEQALEAGKEEGKKVEDNGEAK